MLIIYFSALFNTLGYIGPGMDGGVVASVLGILASFFLVLFAIIWYPFKRFYQRIKKKKSK